MAELVFVDDVSDDSVGQLLDALAEAAVAGEEVVRVRITSNGGDLSAAFAGYDAVCLLRKERGLVVETVASGYCLSAATVLLQAGDVRYSLPHTIFMLHQPKQFPWEEKQTTILMDEVNARRQLQHLSVYLLADIYASRSGQPFDDWYNKLSTMGQEFFGPPGAVSMGLVDEVLSLV